MREAGIKFKDCKLLSVLPIISLYTHKCTIKIFRCIYIHSNLVSIVNARLVAHAQLAKQVVTGRMSSRGSIGVTHLTLSL